MKKQNNKLENVLPNDGTLPASRSQIEKLKETAEGRGVRLGEVTGFVYDVYGVDTIGCLNAHQIEGVINFVKRSRRKIEKT